MWAGSCSQKLQGGILKMRETWAWRMLWLRSWKKLLGALGSPIWMLLQVRVSSLMLGMQGCLPACMQMGPLMNTPVWCQGCYTQQVCEAKKDRGCLCSIIPHLQTCPMLT